MLRYRFLADDAITDKIAVPVEDYTTVALDGDYFHKVKRYFIVANTDNIVKGGTVNAIHRVLVHNDLARNAKMGKENIEYYDTITNYDDFVKARNEDDMLTPSDGFSKYVFNENLFVADVTDDGEKIGKIFFDENEEPLTYGNSIMFTAITDRFFKLQINKVSTFTNTTYFVFEKCHFFNPSNNKVYLWMHFTDNGKDINAKIECEYVNITTLKTTNIDNTVFVDNTGETVSISVSVLKSLLSREDLYKNIVYMRESPFFAREDDRTTKDRFIIFTHNPKKGITIGLSRNDAINMMQSDYANSFVEKTKRESINGINEMEKDVYHPVILRTGYNSDGTPSDTSILKIDDVYTIKFNLHFREHRGDDWLVNPDSFWNGTQVYEDGGRKLIKLIEKIGDARFFNDIDKADSQSDLLSYLNFKDEDVKYRKNKLKKSFLRLSFYDSTNPANQNLLAYSTIFVDSGDLYGRYLKYGGFSSSNNSSENGNYMSLLYDKDGNITGQTGLTGIRVNREYDGKDENVEERRLSSQFVVKGRDTSDSSSEGFYLYLWKDNDSGVVPSNIYMKVEFNHAGYGRTIPFMMPYWDRKTTSKCGIKTSQDILKDWNGESKDVYNNDRDTRYTVQDYIKYSYIKLKYRYDKENERHIYYLDDTVYGESAYFKDNTITFNLYEAKII